MILPNGLWKAIRKRLAFCFVTVKDELLEHARSARSDLRESVLGVLIGYGFALVRDALGNLVSNGIGFVNASAFSISNRQYLRQ